MQGWLSQYFNVKLDADYKAGNYFLRIEYRFYPKDIPRRVILRCLSSDFAYEDQLPFAYQILDAVPGDQYKVGVSSGSVRNFDIYPLLRLVAGPGVEIKLENFKPDARPNISNPGLEIFRVQSPDSVPTQAMGINPGYFQGLSFLPEDFWPYSCAKGSSRGTASRMCSSTSKVPLISLLTLSASANP